MNQMENAVHSGTCFQRVDKRDAEEQTELFSQKRR